jgi:hypothetical protein
MPTSPQLSSFTALIKGVALFAAIVFPTTGTLCYAQTPAAPDGWVVLPVEEYRALWRAAYPPGPEPKPPPLEATLTRLDYDLSIDGELASGEVRLTVDVIKEGWVRVAMPAGLLVREARVDGEQVSLVTDATDKGARSNYLLMKHTGRSILSLTIVAPISSVAGTEMLKLPVGGSPVVRASVVSTRHGVDARVTGGLLLESSETASGSRWVAYGNGPEALTFAWKRKIEDLRATQPTRLRGEITQLVALGEESTQITAEVQIEVLQGLTKEIRIETPEQFNVNRVSGATIADWDAKLHELTVTLLEPLTQTTRFSVAGEIRLPRDGRVDVPLLRLRSVERETGGVAVEVLGAGEIRDAKANGLDEAEASDLGQLISSRQSPLLIAFRMRPGEGQSSRSLSVQVARYATQAVLTANIEEARYRILLTDDGKALVQTRFAVRNNQRDFLKFNLPQGASLWSVSVAGRRIRPGSAPDGLLVPLEKVRTGEETPAFEVEIVYIDPATGWADRGTLKLSLLAVDMAISKSSVILHYPPLYRLTPRQGSFRPAPYQPPESPALARRSNNDPAEARIPAGTLSGATGTDGDTAKEPGPRSQMLRRASRPSRNMPIRVAFPNFGPALFLVTELTDERRTPVIEVDVQRDKKAR